LDRAEAGSWQASESVVRSSLAESILIAPEGELDIASLGAFRAALSDAASTAAARLVVDLSRLESIDSSGLGALVELDNRLRRENRRLAVVAPGGAADAMPSGRSDRKTSTAAAVLMNLSGMQNRLVTYENRAAAIEGVL
jgi:anti-anti-sigma factor